MWLKPRDTVAKSPCRCGLYAGIYNDVVDKCISLYGNLKTESFAAYLDPLKNLEYEHYTGTNKTTEVRIVNDIRSALRTKLEISGDMF